MKRTSLLTLAAGFSVAITPLHAGHMVAEPDKKVVQTEEKHTWFPEDPAGLITVGGLFSQHLSGVYLDTITGIWAPLERDAFLFLDSTYHYEDTGSQFVQSTGLGFRKLIPGKEVIIGANVFYDAVGSSQRDNDFQQLGFGVELLTHWVDARFNYYLPEDKQFEVDRFTRRDTETERFPGGVIERRDRKRTFKAFEAPLEGFITEIGFLLPFEKYTEVRLFAGYHHYNNPYGKDFEGFQARMEARLLPGLIADLEYWDDTYLMGGHWTAGVRVSLPFSLFALARGHNPFEGASDYFRPRQREFSERMSEMVVRSHRVKTVISGPELASDKETVSHAVVVAAPNGAPGFVQVPFE